MDAIESVTLYRISDETASFEARMLVAEAERLEPVPIIKCRIEGIHKRHKTMNATHFIAWLGEWATSRGTRELIRVL